MDPGEHGQDRELARRAARGDDAAWREIYDTTCQPLFNLLCYQAGDREAARDLLQETYLAAAGNLDRFQGSGSLLSWLRSIGLRKSLDWKRSLWRRARKLASLAAESPEPATVAQEASRTEASLEVESLAVREALASLSGQQRAALLLRELEDLTFREIGKTLGCQEATARVHYHRALEKMKRTLTAADGSDPAAGWEGDRHEEPVR